MTQAGTGKCKMQELNKLVYVNVNVNSAISINQILESFDHIPVHRQYSLSLLLDSFVFILLLQVRFTFRSLLTQVEYGGLLIYSIRSRNTSLAFYTTEVSIILYGHTIYLLSTQSFTLFNNVKSDRTERETKNSDENILVPVQPVESRHPTSNVLSSVHYLIQIQTEKEIQPETLLKESFPWAVSFLNTWTDPVEPKI